jgi:hypothetical protein
MSDRNDSLALEHGTAGIICRTGETPQRIAARTDEPRGHLTIVKTAPPIGLPAATAATQAPIRKSHLQRLIEALHRSRRLQATKITHDYLYLVVTQLNDAG